MSAIQHAERKYQEWLKWYAWNRKTAEANRDLMRRIEFLEKAVKGCYEVNALLLDAIKQANNNNGYNGLYLPSQILLNADELRSK